MNIKSLGREWVMWALLHTLIFLGLFAGLEQFFYPAPGGIERQVALNILGGQIPYRDFPSEYPPIALLSFLLPALLFRGPLAYSWAFAGEMLLFDLAIMALVVSIASRLQVSVRSSLIAYTLLVLAIGPLMTTRYDLLPAVLVVAALSAFAFGKRRIAWVALALGFASKLYPLIIAPLFAINRIRDRQYSALIADGLAFLAVVLAVALPWLILDSSGLLYTISYHLERGLHSESSYGTALLVGQLLGLTKVTGEFTFGSWNLESPLADSLAHWSFYLTVAFLAAIYGLYAWRLWRSGRAIMEIKPEPSAVRLNFQFATLAIVAFLLTNKVFSPQYLIWVCPLVAISGWVRYLSLWLLAAAVLSQYVYPYHYIGFELGEPYLVMLMAVRNLLVVGVGILLALSAPVPELTEEQNDAIMNRHNRSKGRHY